MKGAFDLAGKNIVLTGGLGLLGRSFSKSLLDNGANLVVLDIEKKEAGEKILASFAPADKKNKVIYFKADITNKENLERVREEVLRKFGKIDSLINNAALNPAVKSGGTSEDDSFENFDLKKWNKMFEVNVTGTMLCCQVFGSKMAGGSSIVNIASLYGVLAPDQRIYKEGFVKPVSYTATKGAVIALTRYLAAYWGPKGMRVNSISPGGILADQDKDFVGRYSVRVPLGRMANVEEISGSLVFLCSDAASYVNGVNLMVDGGMSIW